MSENYLERIGEPFQGKDLEKLKDFLQEQELTYDENIEYTVILEDQGEIIATGSCHGNVMKCIAVSAKYQGKNLLSEIMTSLVRRMFEQGITHYFGFTKPKNRQIFSNMGLYPVAETENILLMENKKNGRNKYMEKLKKETKLAMDTGTENKQGNYIGAIVANCNPFTKGHRYLIEYAAKHCRWLHLFILSEEQRDFTTAQRFEMVREGVKDIPNVILHKTSDYLISPAVFPTYFIKDKANAYEMNCRLDLHIFCEYIAKELEIDARFIGSEPKCQVTSQYNQCLKEVLPQHAILVNEIPRLEIEGEIVSASAVRQAWKAGKPEEVKNFIPDTTRKVLEKIAEVQNEK